MIYSANDVPRHVRPKLDATTAEALAKSGVGRGRLMEAAQHGDAAARDALRAYYESPDSTTTK